MCVCGSCMSEYRNEMVKTFTAEATSLKFTYIPYVFETFLQVVEIITTYRNKVSEPPSLKVLF